jgi:hypothetical protein
VRANQKHRIRAAVAPLTASALLFAGAAVGISQANRAVQPLGEPKANATGAAFGQPEQPGQPDGALAKTKSDTSDLAIKVNLHTGSSKNDACAMRFQEIDRLPAGCPLTAELIITNNGTKPATHVKVVAPQPNGWVSPIISQPAVGCALDANEDLACDMGTIPAGGAARVVVEGVTADASEPFTMSSVARVSADGIEQTPEDNVATDILIVQPDTDVSISVSAQPEVVTPGEEITVTATVVNNGPSAARGVRILQSLTDALTADFTDTSVTTSDGSEAGCKDLVQNANTARCKVDVLAAGATATMVVKGRAASSLNRPGQVITTTAGVSSNTSAINTSNNTAEAVITLDSPISTLSMGVSGPESVAMGEKATWTFTIENIGPSDSTNTKFKLTVPDELKELLVTSDHGPCTLNECDLGALLSSEDPFMPGNTSEVAVTGVVAKATPFKIHGVVTSDSVTGLTHEHPQEENPTGRPSLNRLPIYTDDDTDGYRKEPRTVEECPDCDATATDAGSTDSGAGEDALAEADNEATANVKVDAKAAKAFGSEALADMSVSNFKITPVDPSYTGPGSQRLIQLDVTNNGPNAAQFPYFRLGRSTDAEANLSSFTTMRVNDQKFKLNMTDLCQTTPRELMCALTSGTDFLNPGESVHVEYTITLASLGRPGHFTDYVHGYSQTEDPNQINDNAQADIVIGEPATALDVTVEPTGTVSNFGSPGMPGSMAQPDGHPSFIAGGSFQYTINLTVPDGEHADATGVTVRSNLPAGFKADSAVTSDGRCEITGGRGTNGSQLSCQLPTVSAGSTSTIVVGGSLADNANDLHEGDAWAEQVPMQVTATTVTPDHDGFVIRSSATTHVDIIESADLQLYVTPDEAGTADVGTIGYTLTVLNVGPSGVEHAAITAVVPDGYQFLADQSNCEAPPNAEIDLGGDHVVDVQPVVQGFAPGSTTAIICKVGQFGSQGFRTGELPAGDAGQVRVVFQKTPGAATSANDITFVAGSLAYDPNHANNQVIAPLTNPDSASVLTPGTRVANAAKDVLHKVMNFGKR